jgi:hypothetical protein
MRGWWGGRKAGVAILCWAACTGAALAADAEPVAAITPSQQKALDGTYFNCDHEGSLGCLEIDCKARKADRAEIRYLYHDVWQNFPELLTPALRACFVKAGGKFR